MIGISFAIRGEGALTIKEAALIEIATGGFRSCGWKLDARPLVAITRPSGPEYL
jgi:hypothetical protein